MAIAAKQLKSLNLSSTTENIDYTLQDIALLLKDIRECTLCGLTQVIDVIQSYDYEEHEVIQGRSIDYLIPETNTGILANEESAVLKGVKVEVDTSQVDINTPGEYDLVLKYTYKEGGAVCLIRDKIKHITVLPKDEYDNTEYLTFISQGDFSLKTKNGSKNWDGKLEYSTDKIIWTVWTGEEINSVDKKLYLRGSGNTKFASNYSQSFVLLGESPIECRGNLKAITQEKADFDYLFYESGLLSRAPEIPIDDSGKCLATGFYQAFYGCKNLKHAFTWLPSYDNERYMYYGTFSNCINLERVNFSINEDAAGSIAESKYQNMFYNCLSLIQAPYIKLTRNGTNSLNGAFKYCKSLAKFPCLISSASSNSMVEMLSGCTNLKYYYYTDSPASYAITKNDKTKGIQLYYK